MRYEFWVNGLKQSLEVPGSRRLLDVLREDLHLTGTKEGCGEGECGACSVLIDGELANSCLVPVSQVDRGQVTTVEGLSGPRLSALQDAFVRHRAFQCGFCTPGLLLRVRSFLSGCFSSDSLAAFGLGSSFITSTFSSVLSAA